MRRTILWLHPLQRGKTPIYHETDVLVLTLNFFTRRVYEVVILNERQTTICEEIEIYSQEKVYKIDRLLVDKNIGLVNTE